MALSIPSLIRQRQYQQALVEINRLLANDTYNIELLQLQAEVFYKMNDYARTTETYTTLINLLPNDAENYAGRGLAYYQLGQGKLSLADFDRAVALEPSRGYRYASRAYIKDNLGDHLGALADYTKAIELDPEDAISLNNRGLVEEKLGRMHLAQESFTRADELVGFDAARINYPKNPLPPKPPAKRVGFRQFMAVVKTLLTSGTERKKFYRFLFNR